MCDALGCCDSSHGVGRESWKAGSRCGEQPYWFLSSVIFYCLRLRHDDAALGLGILSQEEPPSPVLRPQTVLEIKQHQRDLGSTAEVLCGFSSGQRPQAWELVSSEVKWASSYALHNRASSPQESTHLSSQLCASTEAMGREDMHVSGVSLELSELTLSLGRWSMPTCSTDRRKYENELNKNISVLKQKKRTQILPSNAIIWKDPRYCGGWDRVKQEVRQVWSWKSQLASLGSLMCSLITFVKCFTANRKLLYTLYLVILTVMPCSKDEEQEEKHQSAVPDRCSSKRCPECSLTFPRFTECSLRPVPYWTFTNEGATVTKPILWKGSGGYLIYLMKLCKFGQNSNWVTLAWESQIKCIIIAMSAGQW